MVVASAVRPPAKRRGVEGEDGQAAIPHSAQTGQNTDATRSN